MRASTPQISVMVVLGSNHDFRGVPFLRFFPVLHKFFAFFGKTQSLDIPKSVLCFN